MCGYFSLSEVDADKKKKNTALLSMFKQDLYWKGREY